jgi:polysaccharide pyruvyl transferase WcaK-like protein
LFEREKNFITVRNDGSLDELKNLTNTSQNAKLLSIPDGGFFIDKVNKTSREKTLVINVAADMEIIRYKAENGGVKNFIQLMAQYINKMQELHNFDRIVFTQHVIGDLALINSIIELIDEKTKRHCIETSSYGMNLRNTKELLRIYANATLVLGQRFHANVAALAFRRPTVGLSTYPQIFKLYKELDSVQHCAELRNSSDLGELIRISDHAISNPDGYMHNLNFNLDKMYENTVVKHAAIATWIKSNLA